MELCVPVSEHTRGGKGAPGNGGHEQQAKWILWCRVVSCCGVYFMLAVQTTLSDSVPCT